MTQQLMQPGIIAFILNDRLVPFENVSHNELFILQNILLITLISIFQ